MASVRTAAVKFFQERNMKREIVGHNEWTEARKALLATEKEFTRLRDQVTQQRQQLPWEKVEKSYEFDGPNGPVTLAELFDGRSQLIIYHLINAMCLS